jgi:cysteine-rich CPCC protein
MAAFDCPCCLHFTLDQRGQYSICPVCFWEDDGEYRTDVSSDANSGMTIDKARENYKKFHAMDERFIAAVRAPLEDE